MQINSRNSMSFGCGGCAAAYKKAEKIAKIQGTSVQHARLCARDSIKRREVLMPPDFNEYVPHGQAASQENRDLGKQLKKLTTQA